MKAMNEPTNENPIPGIAAECCADLDAHVRSNPGTALLIAVGTGLAIGLLVRALQPEPTPQHRTLQLLKDAECRIRKLTGGALQKAGEFASDEAHTMQEHLQSGGAGLARMFRDARKRVEKLFA